MVLLYNVGELRTLPCPFGHGNSIEYIVSQEKEDLYLIQIVRAGDQVGKEIYFQTQLDALPDTVTGLAEKIKEKYLSESDSLLDYKSYFKFIESNYGGDREFLEEEFFLALDRSIVEKGVWHPVIAGVYLFQTLGSDAMKTVLQEDCDTSTLSSLIMGMLQKCGEPSVRELLKKSENNTESNVIKLSSIFRKSETIKDNITEFPIATMEIEDVLGYGLCYNLLENGQVIASLECIHYLEDHVVIELTSKDEYDKVIGPSDNLKKLCISKLTVNTDRRRKGIGTAFVAEILKRLKQNGKQAVILQAYPTDGGSVEDLIRFYSKLGFEIIYDKPTDNKFKRMVLMLLYL